MYHSVSKYCKQRIVQRTGHKQAKLLGTVFVTECYRGKLQLRSARSKLVTRLLNTSTSARDK